MAQAGNVAVPGAAREHFVPSSVPVESSAVSSTPASPGPIAKASGAVKRENSSRFKKRILSSAFGDGDSGDDERDDGFAVFEGGIGTDMVDVGRGGPAATPVLPQWRVNRGGGAGAHTPTNVDAVLAEEGGAGNNIGLHARRLSPRRREHVGSGSAGGRNRHEAPSSLWSSPDTDC